MREPAGWGALATLVVALGGVMAAEQETRPVTASGRVPLPVFPNYKEMPARVPQAAWYAGRAAGLTLALGTAALCFASPSTGLFIFWRLVTPALPILFFLAPGVWRNICPMAALNQAPRRYGITRALTLPSWLREHAYLIAGALFVLLVAARKPLLNANGPALGAVLLAALALAGVSGAIFKGKSGWCSSLCPLLPLQRLYGQTPFAVVPNSYCSPCVSCATYCYDFNPHTAHLSDLFDPDERHRDIRRLFAAILPGVVLAFFTLPVPSGGEAPRFFAQFGLFLLASTGSFFALSALVRAPRPLLVAIYGGVAINLFYWFALPQDIQAITGSPLPAALQAMLSGLLLALTAIWLYRTLWKTRVLTGIDIQPAPVPSGQERKGRTGPLTPLPGTQPLVTFLPHQKVVPALPNVSLLEVIEAGDLHIEAGCRLGMCGADPVAILSGAEYLSPIKDDERTTLERLGLAPNTRMACCARVRGPVTVSLTPERAKQMQRSMVLDFRYDPAVQRVVIIGNGIAGVTSADHVRRRHPRCEIHLVGQERYHLYNRMGISRLVYGRSAMQGLSLLPESWYDQYQITCWLNTWALSLDAAARQVTLATGDTLPYDRLVLATGSSSFVPRIEGFGLPGTFLLRFADDAMEMRVFAQVSNCRRALVAGGGALGLEAAYALHKLGMQVTVLERSGHLLHRQVDAAGSAALRTAIEATGIEVLERAEVAAVSGTDRVRRVIFTDGREHPCDLLLVCAGIRPNIALAREAQLQTNRGVVVDDTLRASDPAIFAAGDVAEFRGEVSGLWPVAVKQAEVVALNVVGGEAHYEGTVPVMILKVPGIELTSVGRIEPGPGEEAIVLDEPERGLYRKLVLSGGQAVGAIVLGSSTDATAATAAVRAGADLAPALSTLQAGNWDVLETLAAQY